MESVRLGMIVVGWVLCILLLINFLSCEEISIPLMLFIAFWAYLLLEATRKEGDRKC